MIDIATESDVLTQPMNAVDVVDRATLSRAVELANQAPEWEIPVAAAAIRTSDDLVRQAESEGLSTRFGRSGANFRIRPPQRPTGLRLENSLIRQLIKKTTSSSR
jgi:hypothetical protein